MANENCVILSTASYNQIKSENTKFHLFIERIWEGSSLSKDKAHIDFDMRLVSKIMHLVYPDAYKKRLSYLRGQDTREAMKKMKEEQIDT